MMSEMADTSCKVVLAGTVAKNLLEEVKLGLSMLNGRQPHLLGILANQDAGAKVYAGWTERTCRDQ